MKKRSGWVSNSSSSSFIIGAGVIKDEKALLLELENNKCDEWDYSIVSLEELKQSSSYNFNYDDKTRKLRVVASTNDEPNISTTIPSMEDIKVFIVNVGNDEGDSSFTNEGDWHCNYDQVDYNWFSKDQQVLIDLLDNKNIIINSSGAYLGAGRNG